MQRSLAQARAAADRLGWLSSSRSPRLPTPVPFDCPGASQGQPHRLQQFTVVAPMVPHGQSHLPDALAQFVVLCLCGSRSLLDVRISRRRACRERGRAAASCRLHSCHSHRARQEITPGCFQGGYAQSACGPALRPKISRRRNTTHPRRCWTALGPITRQRCLRRQRACAFLIPTWLIDTQCRRAAVKSLVLSVGSAAEPCTACRNGPQARGFFRRDRQRRAPS